MNDLVIRGGTVIDGTGSAARRADISIANGVIEELGAVNSAGIRTIDASDLVIAPGFFDFHSHADFTIPNYPNPINSISQGVTTEVIGNCGFSPAPVPVDPDHQKAFKASNEGLGPALDWRWSSFSSFLNVLDEISPPVNCVPLVGHNAVRSSVMGYEDRPPTDTELSAMKNLIVEAMESGAWGVSSGLIYPPGVFCDVAELAALAAVAAGYGGLYSSHVRNEGAGLLEAVTEAVEVGRRSGATVQVSHLKAAGVNNCGLVHGAFDVLDQARAEGIDVYCDVYPYTAASTFLAMVAPPWSHEGGFDELARRLASREQRDRIRHEMLNEPPGWSSIFLAAGDWERIVISSVAAPALVRYEGASIAAIATTEGKDPFETAFDLLAADEGRTMMVAFLMEEADVFAVLRYPWSVLGSDQLLVTGRERKIHPRAYGTYARVVGPLVRDEGLFSLETAVHKMSGLPASILGTHDRGRIAPGFTADLVLFDPLAVSDRATYVEPTVLASGIDTVLISGEVAYHSGEATTPGLGRVLRRR